MTPREPNRISEGRKTLYYLGMGLMILGGLSFGSTFVSAALNFGDFDLGPEFGKSLAIRGFGGMFLMIGGGALMGIGRAGMAGAGVILDPDQAREDLKPWNRMAGQMMNDQLNEVEPIQKIAEGLSRQSDEPKEVIRIRCRHCGALETEDARFCSQCGKEV